MPLSSLKTTALAALLALGAASAQADVTVFSEDFESVSLGSAPPAGWLAVNRSANPGTIVGAAVVPLTWFGGNSGIFPAQAGSPGSYMADDYLRATSGTLDDWLITPTFALGTGGTFSFYARSHGDLPDGMKVLFSPTGGTAAADFSVVSLTIDEGSFPTDWTHYTFAYAGGAGSGRVAFEYLVSDVASAGDYVGIDSVSATMITTTGVAEPASLVLVMAAVVGLAATRRRHETEE